MTLQLFLFQTVALLITAFLIPRLQVTGPLSAAIGVVCLAIVNTTLWDTSIFFSIPYSATVQTIAIVFTNGVIFYLLAKLLPGIEVEGFLPALVAPIVFTVVSAGVDHFGRQIDWGNVAETGVKAVGKIRETARQIPETTGGANQVGAGQ